MSTSYIRSPQTPLISTPPLLEVRQALKIYGGGFFSSGHRTVALQNCSLLIEGYPARITAIAGESGSGKSTLGGAVLGFVRLDSGTVLFRGKDVEAMSRTERFEYRREVQAVFQDPYAVFNPFYPVDHLFNLVMKRFGLASTYHETQSRIADALHIVGLRPEDILGKHPHQLSGGQRQRIMIARACLMAPKLIVADEPVSMVDASLRSTILDIMLRLRDEHNISFLYITHDLSTAYQICDDIHIFYRGSQVESGPVASVLRHPRHPYTQLLLASIPEPDPTQDWGSIPNLQDKQEHTKDTAEGCPFYPRCPKGMAICKRGIPDQIRLGLENHNVACYLHNQTPDKRR